MEAPRSPEPSFPAPGLSKPSWHQRAWAGADQPPDLLAVLANWHSRGWPSALTTGPQPGLGPQDGGKPPHVLLCPRSRGGLMSGSLSSQKARTFAHPLILASPRPWGPCPPPPPAVGGADWAGPYQHDGADTLNSVVFVSICLCSDECIYFSDLGRARGRPGSATARSCQTEPPRGLVQDCKKETTNL